MKKLLLALLTVVLVPTFQVNAAYDRVNAADENVQNVQERPACKKCVRVSKCPACVKREPKPCVKKTCVKKERVCKKPCPRTSRCPRCVRNTDMMNEDMDIVDEDME